MRRGAAFRPIAGIVTICSVLACKALTDPLERDVEDIPADEIISLQRVHNIGPLSADGVATDTLEALLHPQSQPRSVKFTTTAGRFVESETAEITIRAVLDRARSRLVARTVLRAGTTPTVAKLRASVGEFYDTLSIAFTQ